MKIVRSHEVFVIININLKISLSIKFKIYKSTPIIGIYWEVEKERERKGEVNVDARSVNARAT